MKKGQASVKKIAKLLESAAKKHNESADATCSVADCLRGSSDELGDEVFGNVFEMVTELARLSLDKKPDCLLAARELLARAHRRGKSA